MENNVVQRNSKVLSEVNVAEYSSREENQQNDQLNMPTRKTDNQAETSYKKLSRSCEKFPPLIRKNSNDGLFLSHSMSSKTLMDHLCPAENKSSKTFQTIDIMKIKEGNLKQDETKDAGIKTGSNTPEIINNDGLPSLFPNIPSFSSFDFSKTGFPYRRSSEVAQESFAQKAGIFHLSIEKPDTRPIMDHKHPLVASSKDEISTQEEGNTDVPKPCQSGLNASQNFNKQCSYLRSTSSLAFSYHSSSGSSFSSSLSQSLSSPRESYLSQSLNSGQQREKQLKKNTQNLRNSLSHEDISQISCLSQPHEEQCRMLQLHSLETSQTSCNADINRHSGSKNVLSGALENCQEQTNSSNNNSNFNLDKEASSEVLVSEKETGSAESTKISETGKIESVAKKNLSDKSTLIKPEQIELFSSNISPVNSQNKTPNSAKATSKPQKMYRSSTVAKIENLSSRNETRRQMLLNLQRRPNYQKSVSSLRPKDVGVCISSVTMHKRNERNVTKHLQNKGDLFENKINESRKPLVSELVKQHKVRMAPNGENKPLLDILAQRTQTTAVTKLDSCVKIEDMFKKLRERKNEPHPNNKTVNKQKTVVEPKKILQNISGSKLPSGKLHQPNENQESKKFNKHPNRKWSNEKDGKSHKMSRKHQSKSKRKNPKQFSARSESEEDLRSKLNPNMAIISGSNWHIVTDCIDVRNVKVVNHSNICQEYTSSNKDDDDPNSSKQNENNKMIDDFHPEFLNNLINNQENGKKLSHLTIHNLNIQNSNSSYDKLSSVDESPEILKMDDISRNKDWNDTTISPFDDTNTELLNVLSENLSVQDKEHEYKDFNKGLPQSEYVAENVNPVVADSDSEYETDFECLSLCESDCAEDVENLSEKTFAENQQKDQIKTAEVNQENLDSVVEELLNYSTSPVCLEKRLSNISLPESDSILLRSLKHQKNSPFYAQSKSDNTTTAEEEITDVKENLDVSGAKTSFHRNLKSQASHKFHCVDGHSSDKESASFSQLEELNNKHAILCRRDSTSTTSSFLSIGEDFTWKKGDLLGSGSYGRVWRGLTSDGEQIAVKQIVLDVSDREKAEREYQKVQEEVEILKTLQHKNIVSFLGMRREGEEVSIFMQYVTGGSIAQLLARFGPLDEPVFCSYTQQILEGVKYLHDRNVIHRDIKGGNVMLMPNSTIKLVDFGCAKRLCYSLNKNSLCNPTSLQGTPYWMAPEVIQETGHGKKSDIWSIGCTVFEMATKSPPWSDMNPYAAIFAICSSKPVPALPSDFSQKARDFVRVCLIRDPAKRPTASELLQDKFITTSHHGRRRKSVTCFN